MNVAVPYLDCSRPALEMLERIGFGQAHFGFEKAAVVAGKPRPTVVRYLNELVDASLILRVRRDWYATPPRATYSLLLAEPNAYFRSVLLHHEATPRSFDRPVFACLGVREVLDFELPKAIPVFRIDHDTLSGNPDFPSLAEAGVFTDALRFNFQDRDVGSHVARFPSNEQDEKAAISKKFRALKPEASLALLAATADPRLLGSVTAAAQALDVSTDVVLDRARKLHPQQLPLQQFHPNSVVFPRWLENFAETARALHAQHAIRDAADKPHETKQGRRRQ